MALVVWARGALMLIAKNIIKRPNGTYFYQRRIPKELKKHYPHVKGAFIRQSLGTKDAVEAGSKDNMTEGQGWVFPRYAADHNIRAVTASGTLAKWIGVVTGTDKTAHSFRHSMRDRLRDARVPTELQDKIGGWRPPTVGQAYGEGYSLEILRTEMLKVVLD